MRCSTLNLLATALVSACLIQVATPVCAYECPPETESSRRDVPGGSVAMCLDSEERPHGLATPWYPDGTLRSRDAWNHGRKDGTWETYHANGAIRSRIEFKAGRENGPSMWWFDGGQQKNSTIFVDGVRHGPVAEWDESGRQTVSGQFGHDKPIGTWVFFDPAKKAVFAGTFSDGEPVSIAELNENPSCPGWSEAGSSIRTQFATFMLIELIDKALQHPLLSDAYPLSLEIGACALRHSDEFVGALDAECKSSKGKQASPLGERAAAIALEIGKACLPRPGSFLLSPPRPRA